MEFSVHPLSDSLDVAKTLSGLRFHYALGGAELAFSPSGSLLLALRHPLMLRLGEQTVRVARFGAYYIPAEQALGSSPAPLRAQSVGPWLMLSASEVTWRVLVSELRRMGAPSAQPIAGLWPQASELSRWALKTVRQARHCPCSTLQPLALFALAKAFEAAMAGFDPWIARCPGRWAAQKLQVFRRLMRVRQLIDLRCTDSLPLEALANLANYSRAHFLTVFRDVFGETPHAQLLERRLGFARRMLVEQRMSVQETTLAAGFEDRSSFSKLFRRRFGVTAQAMRAVT
jgi:AraC family transcriptional regulator